MPPSLNALGIVLRAAVFYSHFGDKKSVTERSQTRQEIDLKLFAGNTKNNVPLHVVESLKGPCLGTENRELYFWKSFS